MLPLRRLGLPLSGLVIGSMVPDTPMYVGSLVPTFPMSAAYHHTHSLLGLLTTNLVIGLVFWAAWDFLVRPALYDGLPDRLRRRASAMGAGSRRSRNMAWLLPLAVLIGAATHVGLDELSHGGRWAANNIAWFRREHFGLYGTTWVQYGAAVLGLTIVAGVLLRGLWRAEPRETPRIAPRIAAAVWVAPLLAAVLVAAAGGLAWLSGTPLLRAAFVVATAGGGAMVLTAVAAAAVWRVRAERAQKPVLPAIR